MRVISFVLMLMVLLLSMASAVSGVSAFSGSVNREGWVDSFDLEECEFSSSGENSYFFLQPGYQLILEGEEDGEAIQLTVTVLNETKVVDGIETRVVEERETENGELIEVSRNYFALCAQDNDIFYFGEDVDMYEDGEIVSHEGAWLAGIGDAEAGVIIPAKPEVGLKYYQEVAPGVAEDRAEIISLNEVVDTPAGKFENVLKVEETTPLEPGVKEYKFHAPRIGLIQDAELKLVEYVLPEIEDTPDDLKPMVQSVVIAGKTIEVETKSSSTISDFIVEEENKRVTFKVGETGTEGTTEISIGRILEGPYMMTIDGQTTSNFVVTQAEDPDEILIKISYTRGTHDVIVIGTNVVPEFPFSAIGVVAAMVGLVVFLGRSGLVGDFIRRM